MSSLLIDSHKPHKTDLVKEKCERYNIRLFIVDGGLPPKANMADVDYVKSTKKLVNESLMRWRMEKYKEQKARQTGVMV